MKDFIHCGVAPDLGMVEEFGRRNKVPVIFVTGSHYEIGFDVGRTFSSMIKEFISLNERLRQFEVEYKSEAGRLAYEKTLGNMKKRFPQYVSEIQGTADGAGVPFYLLFLLQMDDIIETINESLLIRNDAGGCSSIGINKPEATILGHTEDAFSETLNHFYIMSAHVIPTAEERARGAVEERFASLCYAGQLPGYTMGYTEQGMVFSINTLSPRNLKPGYTPRTFLTRAMLAAESKEHAEKVLLDAGLGAANGFSVNMVWTDSEGSRKLYNVEVAPDLRNDRSILNVHKFTGCEALIHCNRYERVKVPEVKGPIINSSAARLAALHAFPAPLSRSDIHGMISDQSGKDYVVFQNRDDAVIKTIAAGIFDLDEGLWNIYIQKPNNSEPIVSLPIRFSLVK